MPGHLSIIQRPSPLFFFIPPLSAGKQSDVYRSFLCDTRVTLLDAGSQQVLASVTDVDHLPQVIVVIAAAAAADRRGAVSAEAETRPGRQVRPVVSGSLTARSVPLSSSAAARVSCHRGVVV